MQWRYLRNSKWITIKPLDYIYLSLYSLESAAPLSQLHTTVLYTHQGKTFCAPWFTESQYLPQGFWRLRMFPWWLGMPRVCCCCSYGRHWKPPWFEIWFRASPTCSRTCMPDAWDIFLLFIVSLLLRKPCCRGSFCDISLYVPPIMDGSHESDLWCIRFPSTINNKLHLNLWTHSSQRSTVVAPGHLPPNKFNQYLPRLLSVSQCNMRFQYITPAPHIQKLRSPPYWVDWNFIFIEPIEDWL